MKKISGKHSNRRLYNWLAYDIVDQFLKKYFRKLKDPLDNLSCSEALHQYSLHYVWEYLLKGSLAPRNHRFFVISKKHRQNDA